MKTINFHFCHPVTGFIRLSNQSDPDFCKIIPFDTLGGDVANFQLDGLAEGRWKASLEWQHDGMDYFYERDFEVKDKIPELN